MTDSRIGSVVGVWRLLELTGRGGYCDIYIAERIDQVVTARAAVKISRVPGTRQLSDEAKMLRKLSHQHIARVFESGETPDGHSYIAMEFVDGIPITDYADQTNQCIAWRLALILQACEGVAFAHRHLVAHLDLKPGNILVNREGSVKIIDFGSSSGAERRPVFSGPYASPEQVSGEIAPDFRSDIYSLGAVLYELVCGHAPFGSAGTRQAVERCILEDLPTAPSVACLQVRTRVSSEGASFDLQPSAIARMRGSSTVSSLQKEIGSLDRVCLYALRKRAYVRYRSVRQLMSDIEDVRAGRRPRVARPRIALPVGHALSNRLVVIAAILLAAYLSHAGQLVEAWTKENQEVHRGTVRALAAIIESTRLELSQQLRPRLAAKPELHESLPVLDGVLERTKSPPPRGLNNILMRRGLEMENRLAKQRGLP